MFELSPIPALLIKERVLVALFIIPHSGFLPFRPGLDSVRVRLWHLSIPHSGFLPFRLAAPAGVRINILTFNPTIGLHAIPTDFTRCPQTSDQSFQSHHRASCHSDVRPSGLSAQGSRPVSIPPSGFMPFR
ncbi:MAG TPA: hypothetical protein VJ761_20620, partial [Ktedonobacteraceae bacterium]|nr:hypothetical protein [Ktedonobacteraceae bacterium]